MNIDRRNQLVLADSDKKCSRTFLQNFLKDLEITEIIDKGTSALSFYQISVNTMPWLEI